MKQEDTGRNRVKHEEEKLEETGRKWKAQEETGRHMKRNRNKWE